MTRETQRPPQTKFVGTTQLFRDAKKYASKRDCPRCRVPMQSWKRSGVEMDTCSRCRASFLDPGKTAKIYGGVADPGQWVELGFARYRGKTRTSCPNDLETLLNYEIQWDGAGFPVGVCPKCSGVWFESGQGKAIAGIAREATHTRDRALKNAHGGAPQYFFQLISAMPIEVCNPVSRTPWLTLGFAGICLVSFMLAMALPGEFRERWLALAVTPHEVAHGNQLWTLWSYALVHLSVGHVFGNLYFFVIFGDNIEDTLGRGWWCILVLLFAPLSVAIYPLVYPGSALPVAGASGIISGLLSTYILLFPRTKVVVVWLFKRLVLPVWVYAVVWFAFQLVGAFFFPGGTAWWAHVMGFAFGVPVGLICRKLLLRPIAGTVEV